MAALLQIGTTRHCEIYIFVPWQVLKFIYKALYIMFSCTFKVNFVMFKGVPTLAS